MAVLTAELADLWTANRPQIDARLTTIDVALKRLSTGTLDVGSHAAALAAAHQLAGTAGTYGFAEASELASALLSGLAGPHHGPELVELADALRAALRQPAAALTGAAS